MGEERIEDDSVPEVRPLLTEKRKGRHYHVELFFFLIYIGHQIYATVYVNLLERSYCQYFWDIPEQESFQESSKCIESAQKFASTYQIVYYTLGFLGSILLFAFIGPWSDVHGRKPLALLTTFGYLVTYGLWTWASTVSRINPLYFILFIIPSIVTGSEPVLLFIGHCCICDLTSVEDRSFGLGIWLTSVYAGSVVGSAFGVFLIPYGYVIVCSAASACVLIAAINLCFFFKETNIAYDDPLREYSKLNKNLFQIEYLRELAHCYRKQTKKNRNTIVLVTIGRLIYYMMTVGDDMIIYLFLQLKMNITLHEYAVFSSFNLIMRVMGLAGGTWILSVKFKINDIFILMIISGLQLTTYCVYIFSNNMLLIYIGSVIGCTNYLFVGIFKSLLSKIIDSSDIGKVFAATELGTSLAGIAGSFIYPIVYQLTLTMFPAAIYILSVFACVVILIILTVRLLAEHNEADLEALEAEFKLLYTRTLNYTKTIIKSNVGYASFRFCIL